MKRRSFFSLLAGLAGIPLVAKKAVAQAPAVKPYVVAVDWARDTVEMDRHSVQILRVGRGEKPTVMSYREGIKDHDFKVCRMKLAEAEKLVGIHTERQKADLFGIKPPQP